MGKILDREDLRVIIPDAENRDQPVAITHAKSVSHPEPKPSTSADRAHPPQGKGSSSTQDRFEIAKSYIVDPISNYIASRIPRISASLPSIEGITSPDSTPPRDTTLSRQRMDMTIATPPPQEWGFAAKNDLYYVDEIKEKLKDAIMHSIHTGKSSGLKELKKAFAHDSAFINDIVDTFSKSILQQFYLKMNLLTLRESLGISKHVSKTLHSGTITLASDADLFSNFIISIIHKLELHTASAEQRKQFLREFCVEIHHFWNVSEYSQERLQKWARAAQSKDWPQSWKDMAQKLAERKFITDLVRNDELINLYGIDYNIKSPEPRAVQEHAKPAPQGTGHPTDHSSKLANTAPHSPSTQTRPRFRVLQQGGRFMLGTALPALGALGSFEEHSNIQSNPYAGSTEHFFASATLYSSGTYALSGPLSYLPQDIRLVRGLSRVAEIGGALIAPSLAGGRMAFDYGHAQYYSINLPSRTLSNGGTLTAGIVASTAHLVTQSPQAKIALYF
ncbi:MAG: hypothetical protein KDK50_06885, partial [Chlamydiia bacterium]|nr:hypothetical protein [Chlamydiia bacterium]